MKVEVVNNHEVDRTCPDGRYWRVTWTGDSTWQSKIFPTKDPRLQRYLEAVDQLKYEIGGTDLQKAT